MEEKTSTDLAKISFGVVFALLFATLPARADQWGLIEKTEFQSTTGKHLFKITPHKDWPDHPGHCKGVLFKMNGGKRTQVWSRNLINDHAPVQIFVADSGDYVVTMDEWHRVGDLPVVIYGFQGELVAVHNTKSLGLDDDIEHIKMTVSSFWWNEDSIIFFGPEEKYFFIRLHWGRLLIIELATGRLYERLVNREMYNKDYYKTEEKQWKKLQDYARKKVEEIALSKLNSKKPNERKTGALVVGQLKTHKAIPHLRQLLRDKAYYTTSSGDGPWMIVLFVRKAAKEALEAMGQKVDNVVVELKEKGHLRYDPDKDEHVPILDE